ncbi:MAG: L-fucose/L-arabinose isomerase family protein [Anaerolineae bacterium]|nr:L-fucose/L-arabinose isomerase family protein [Anaerolineae bacterium]
MNPTQDPRLGLVPLARTTFDIPLANQVAGQVRLQLQDVGFQLAGPEELVTNLEETRAVARQLADQPLDLLVVLQATFADSTMVMRLAELVDAPLLLWAVPEERKGGRLRLNSFCGINLGAHALRRSGYRYESIYAPPQDPAALDKIHTLAVAGRARRLLRQTRLGRVGENPDGLDSCKLDKGALARHFGLDVVQVELVDIFEAAKKADSPQVDALEQDLSSKLEGLPALDRAAVRRTLSSYLALRQRAQEERLAGLAVRCWPEFFTELGCAACGAMSMLSDEGTPCSCEADVNGTVTQLMLQWLSGEAAFGTDLVSFDLDEDVAVVWHCGLAPLSMADPAVRPRATVHSNRRLPLLMEFPLKPGRVTIARLSEATGSYRLVVGSGEMLRAPMSFTGTSGVLRFDRPAAKILDTFLGEGLEHHISLTYGDHVPSLLALARMLDLPVLRL